MKIKILTLNNLIRSVMFFAYVEVTFIDLLPQAIVDDSIFGDRVNKFSSPGCVEVILCCRNFKYRSSFIFLASTRMAPVYRAVCTRHSHENSLQSIHFPMRTAYESPFTTARHQFDAPSSGLGTKNLRTIT